MGYGLIIKVDRDCADSFWHRIRSWNYEVVDVVSRQVEIPITNPKSGEKSVSASFGSIKHGDEELVVEIRNIFQIDTFQCLGSELHLFPKGPSKVLMKVIANKIKEDIPVS